LQRRIGLYRVLLDAENGLLGQALGLGDGGQARRFGYTSTGRAGFDAAGKYVERTYR